MKRRITEIQNTIGKIMQERLARQDFESITRISPLLSRAQEFQKREAEFDKQLSELETAVKGLSGDPPVEEVRKLFPEVQLSTEDEEGGRAARQTLKVEVDWRAIGKDKERETIWRHSGAETMTEFLGRLVEELGKEILPKLAKTRIHRGPLISTARTTDFLNHSTGNLYGNRKLRGTDAFVLTHSSTDEKVVDLRHVCRVLGLPAGSVEIRKAKQPDPYANL